jgi:hypothetical protein
MAFLANPHNAFHLNSKDFDTVHDDNTFTIVHFTDLHFGEHDEADALTTQAMQRVLSHETRTALVVFGWDQVTGTT